ncbi:MAG: hypothetical protein AB7U98_13775 [Candidatus Nitrosocosmicus sp.]
MAKIHRSPSAIAADIRREFPRTAASWPYARPYVNALAEMVSWQDVYGPAKESCREIALRFLSNAGAWRGERARQIKNEIKAALGLPTAGNFKD